VKEPAPKTPPSRHASLSGFMHQDIKSSLDSRCSSSEQEAYEGETVVKYLKGIEESETLEEAEIVSRAKPQLPEPSSSPKSIASVLDCWIASQGPQSPDFCTIFDWNMDREGYLDFSPTFMDLVRSWIRFCGRMCSPPKSDFSSCMRDLAVAAFRSHNLEPDVEAGGVPDYLSIWMFGAALISSLLLTAYFAYLASRSG
jgi:hypothetical protein